MGPTQTGFRVCDERADVAAPRAVLVVDDEPSVRAFVLSALKDTGYNLVEADCAERAMEILTDNQQPLALLITNLALPGASGAELVRQARRLIPELPVLLMSGSKQALARAGLLAGDAPPLRKPFAVTDLLAALEELTSGRFSAHRLRSPMDDAAIRSPPNDKAAPVRLARLARKLLWRSA